MGDANEGKSCWWSITINNPTEEDRQALAQLPRFVKSIGGQEEVSKSGTPHFQCWVHTKQCRMNQVKTWLKRAHIEPAQKPEALKTYCSKDDTAVPGTRFTTENRAPQMTMAQALQFLLTFRKMPEDMKYDQLTDTDGKDRFKPYGDGWKQTREAEYWRLANRACEQDINLIPLYSSPQYLRSWIHLNTAINNFQPPPVNEILPPPEASTPVQAGPEKIFEDVITLDDGEDEDDEADQSPQSPQG
nr:MAG: replication associated protein [Cressdnaviricota sp.]